MSITTRTRAGICWRARSHARALPRDVPHRLRFETECHLLQIAIPAGLEAFHKKMGQPAPRIELPPPGQVLDKEKYRRLASEHGLEIIELPQWDKKEEAKR